MLKVVTCLLLLLFPLFIWSGTLKDDFTDGDTSGWVTSNPWNGNPAWIVQDQVLVAKCNQWADSHFVIEASQSWANYQLSVGVKLVEILHPRLSGGGFLMRQTPIHGQYMNFKMVIADETRPLQPPKSRLLTMKGNDWEAKEKKVSINLDQWYQLKLVVSGNRFDGFIDGKKIISEKDDHYDKGMVGLVINGAEVHFDNFVATGDEVPDLNLSVSPQSKLAVTWAEEKRF